MRALLICFIVALFTNSNAQVYIYQSVGYGFDLGKEIAEIKTYESDPVSTGQTFKLMAGPTYSAGLGFELTEKLSLEVGYNYSRQLKQSLPQTASYEIQERGYIKKDFLYDISIDLRAYWEYYSLMFAYDIPFSNFLITLRAGPSLFQGAVFEDIYYHDSTYSRNFYRWERNERYLRTRAKAYNTLGLHFGVKFQYQVNRNIFFNLQANYNRTSFEMKEIEGITYSKNGRGSYLSIDRSHRHFFFERHETSYEFMKDFQPPRVTHSPVNLANIDFRFGIDFYIDKQVIDYLK